MADTNPHRMNRPRYVCDQSATGRFASNNRNESTEYTITVKHIPSTVNRVAVIDFASQFGTLRVEPYISQNNEKLQKIAFLTFTEHSAVERCMNGNRDEYTVSGHPVSVQRWLPVGLTFERSFRLLLFIQTDQMNERLTENDLLSYFNTNYGQTKAFSWTSDRIATMDFEDYDIVDRAILATGTHTIKGMNVRLEKVRSAVVRAAYEQSIAPHEINYCVHVRNIPADTSGERLAHVFGSTVWDILIRKGTHPETDPFEAWIMNIPIMSDAEQLATSITKIDETDIQCVAEKEPLNEWTLCSANRDGWCKHGKECIYRHVFCFSGDGCSNEECPFNHTQHRRVTPNPRRRPTGPIEQQYRIKIDGLPPNMTEIELLTGLKKQPVSLLKLIETPDIPYDAATRHFYLTRQAAEKLARKRVFEWHNYPIRESYIVKCQLEYDRVPSTQLLPSSPLSSTTMLQTDNQWLRTLFAPLFPSHEERICNMPSEWTWTNRRLCKTMSDIYLVYPSLLTDDRLGAMKIYRDMGDLEWTRAKRELLALRTLENELGVVSVYDDNINNEKRQKDAPMWMITQVISNLTLEDYVNANKSQICFHKALLISRQLLEVIQRCHKANVLHRNLHPSNIMVQQNKDPTYTDDIKLLLIDFGLAWIDTRKLAVTDDDDVAMINQIVERHSNQSLKKGTLPILTSVSSKDQRCSPAIDATGVGRILFWLLTDTWPNREHNAVSPHRDNIYQEKINEKLGDARNLVKLRDQILELFDRTFDSFEKWWSVEELLNHLNTMQTVFVEFETAQFENLFPKTIPKISLSLNDSYARIVALIARMKQEFAEQYSTCVKWADESNKWSRKDKDIQVTNVDELIYDYHEQKCIINVMCSVKIEREQSNVYLGIISKNEAPQLTFLCRITKDTNDTDVCRHYDHALKKLVKDNLSKMSSSP